MPTSGPIDRPRNGAYRNLAAIRDGSRRGGAHAAQRFNLAYLGPQSAFNGARYRERAGGGSSAGDAAPSCLARGAGLKGAAGVDIDAGSHGVAQHQLVLGDGRLQHDLTEPGRHG